MKSTTDQTRSFERQGFLELEEVLSEETCKDLRHYVLQDLEECLSDDNDDYALEHPRLSNIRERIHRWDLKLKLSPLVCQAMCEILTNDDFFNLLAGMCHCSKEDIVLAELGGLISENGAPHQEWHADTAHTGKDDPDCICCFITLQETPRALGPTELIPSTHTMEFHHSAIQNFPPKGVMPTCVEPITTQSGYFLVGDALLMDCRLYHRGSANTSDEEDSQRVVFYFTFRSRHTEEPGGFLFTILEDLKGKSLIDFVGENSEPCRN
jgi:hypothetical protein